MGVFKVGDTVQWTSQSAGTWKTKRGVIEMVVPAGKRPSLRGAGLPRNHGSYVARVGGRSCWPLVSKLALINEAAK